MYHSQCNFSFSAQGLYEITDKVQDEVKKSGVINGMCNIFVTHTSCSLCIQENAAPSARADLEHFFNELVPFSDSFTHVAEGRDDMPSHIKTALTSVSINIPVICGHLALGTWQGIYLWEHRSHPGTRNLRVSVWE